MEAMEKIMRDFFWDGPDGEHHCHLVACDQVCRPKERGSLCIGNICLRSRVLQGNGGGDFPVRISHYGRISLLVNMIYTIMCGCGSIKNAIFMSPWNFFSKIYTAFLQSVRTVVKRGNKIRFWEDKWWRVPFLVNFSIFISDFFGS